MIRTLALSMSSGLALCIPFTLAAYAFIDVPPCHWDENWGVFPDRMQSEGFMEGFPDDSFRPDELLTRNEAAMILMHVSNRIRMEKAATDPLIGEVMQSEASIPESPSFTDIPPDHWAYESVTTLENIGVIVGTPDSNFHGDDPITRDDLMLMFARLVRRWGLGYPADGSSWTEPRLYFDENEIYAKLEDGLTDFEFEHPSGLTRLEFAILFSRIWDGLMYFKGDQGYW